MHMQCDFSLYNMIYGVFGHCILAGTHIKPTHGICTRVTAKRSNTYNNKYATTIFIHQKSLRARCARCNDCVRE